jgi:hypothetical protein
MLTVEVGPKVMIYRVRNEPPTFAVKKDFPNLLAIQWEYESPNEHGLPFNDVEVHMLELEHLLTPAFENAQEAFLYACVIGGRVREWQWYVRDRKRTMELVNKTLGELDPFPVQFIFQNDPEWKIYKKFLADSDEDELGEKGAD